MGLLVVRALSLSFLLGILLGGNVSFMQPFATYIRKQQGTQTLEGRSEEAQTEQPGSSSQQSNPVCSSLLNGLGSSPLAGIPSALSLWGVFSAQIHQASRLPEDKGYVHSERTAQLLQLVSPRLPNSVKTVIRGTDWEMADSILHKAHRRYVYLKSSSASHEKEGQPSSVPPPIKILVMGGSVSRGQNCQADINGVSRFKCAWPNRLEQLINHLFQGVLVQIFVVGMGGTNSATGTTVLEYDLLPNEAKNPDIVINNYATNDMHVFTAQRAREENATLRDMVFNMTQDFLRRAWDVPATSCRSSKEYTRPLVFHLDDYLGNEQNEIWSTTELSQAVQVLANYYGFPSMSYADMVRDIVYADTHEDIFSPRGWYKPNNGAYSREIHPGATAHMTMAWMTAYNLLNLATQYCSTSSMPMKDRHAHEKAHFPTKPQRGLPPPLTKSLSLEHISATWQAYDIEQEQRSSDQHQCYDRRCIFSWVSGMDLQQSDPKRIKELFADHVVESNGWILAEKHPKVGFIPTTMGPTSGSSGLTLQFANLTQPIRSVTIFAMKSYGSKWEGSLVDARVQSKQGDQWREHARIEISGFHGKQTSETYTHVMELSQAVAAGDSLRIKFSMAGGDMFKLMGLAVCS